MLRKAGADRDLPDWRGITITALVLASASGHVEVVRLLLAASAEMDCRQVMAPLHLVARLSTTMSRRLACCWKLVLTKIWQTIMATPLLFVHLAAAMLTSCSC